MKSVRWTLIIVIIAFFAVLAIKDRHAKSEQAAAAASLNAKDAVVLPGDAFKPSLTSGKPVLAEFGTESCVICRNMKPVLKKTAQEYAGKATVVYVDIDKFPQLGIEYKIVATPTLFFFDSQGKQVTRHNGEMIPEDIDQQLAAVGAYQ